jgi:hypothetical protein
MKRRVPSWWPVATALLIGAVVSCLLSPYLGNVWTSLGWRRPVQDWMTAHGLGKYAGYYGVLQFYVPDLALNLAGGALAGYVGYRKRIRYAAAYAGSYFAAPYLWSIADGSFSFVMSIHPSWVHVLTAVHQLALVPLAVGASWLAARPKRRREARRAANCCTSCGYVLTGNVSGVCPECGTKVDRPPAKAEAGR